MSRDARVVVICEDSQHRTFIYRLLRSLGFPRHRLDVKPAPVGGGAADQWVRERYADEVDAYRRKSSYRHIGLVTVVDADENSMQRRYQQFSEQLASEDLSRRGDAENICILIPKRNIETWIYALLGEEVNETDAYPKLQKESSCQPAVVELVQFVKNDCPEDLIPSLRRGCRELSNRLPE